MEMITKWPTVRIKQTKPIRLLKLNRDSVYENNLKLLEIQNQSYEK